MSSVKVSRHKTLTWNTRSMKTRTKVTWTTITTNWATTCASITSRLVTPEIQDLYTKRSLTTIIVFRIND